MPEIQRLVDEILTRREARSRDQSFLVGVSGIDASGKGYTTSILVEALMAQGVHAVGINLDRWLHLPEKRFNANRPAEQFYYHGVRFDEMFDQLILPLKRDRSITLDANAVEETSTAYYPLRYEFKDVDVIVLEGVFLFQPAYRNHFDLAIWVDSSFETALERAIERGQEGLPPDETVEAFETIYFPAQRIHFANDNPKASADLIFINDDRLV